MILNTVIKGSSATAEVEEKDVNFFDYDGTIVASYTAEEFADLSSLPDNPTHDGLTAQGWNWTLAEAQIQVSKFGFLDIGQTYTTDDGTTRLYVNVPCKGRTTVPLYFTQTVSDGVSIDWGDSSSPETVAGTGNLNTSHTYSIPGDYCIKLTVAEGCLLGLGNSDQTLCVMGAITNETRVFRNMLLRIEIGERVNFSLGYQFQSCYFLKSITIPNGITSISSFAFANCYAEYVTIPITCTTINNYAFSTSKIKYVIFDESIISFGYQIFLNSDLLKRTCIPYNATMDALGRSFDGCVNLEKINIVSAPQQQYNNCSYLKYVAFGDIQTIAGNAFAKCWSISHIKFKDGLTSIGYNSFGNLYGIAYYDFSDFTSIPTIDSTTFQNNPADMKIIVPDALYDSWIVASNWSSIAANIVKYSVWNA